MKRHSSRLTVAILALTGAAACSAGGSAVHAANTGASPTAGGDWTWLAALHQAILARSTLPVLREHLTVLRKAEPTG